ncbi:hypothetical protein [Vibrio fortis]|nr:hypothetical protein [Vibrio fortis]
MVPDANGNLVENPYKTWKEVNPTLPNIKIEVLWSSTNIRNT